MNIKKVFKRHGFTQAQVAERMGISRGALSSCLCYGKPLPTTLQRIAEAIGADYSEFFEDELPERDATSVSSDCACHSKFERTMKIDGVTYGLTRLD